MTPRRPPVTRALVACCSPLIGFPLLWLFAVGLAQIHVLSVQTPWSSTAWVTILLVPVAFVVGGIAVRSLVNSRPPVTPQRQGVVHRRRLLAALVLVGYAELGREFLTAGTVPLLSRHIDAARVSIHPGALGLLVDALTVAAIVAIAVPPRLLSRSAAPELVIALLALGGFALSGGRQAAAVAGAGLIARLLFWGTPRLRALVLTGILGLALFGVVFYLRTGQELGQSFTNELYGSVVPGTSKLLVPFLPAFFALAINPVVLAKVIAYFPHSMPYGHGSYDAGAIHYFVHASSLATVTAKLSAPWLVATAAGPLWADGGLIAVLGGFLAIGAITTYPHALFRRTRRFSHAALAGYFASIALFCVYQDLLTAYKDWVFVAIGLLLVGRQLETAEGSATPLPTPATSVARTLLGVTVAAAIGALAVVIVVADRDVTRSRSAQPLTALSTGGPSAPARGHVHRTAADAVEDSLTVSPAVRSLLRDHLADDAVAGQHGVIWAFADRSHAIVATSLALTLRSITTGPTVRLPGPTPAGSVAWDVGPWGTTHAQPAAFALQQHGDRVSVTAYTLHTGSRRLFSVLTPTLPRLPGGHRSLAITATGQAEPSLLVIDRTDAGAVTVLEYSGASHFQRRVAVRRLGRRLAFPPDRWHVLVGAAQSNGPDLVFIGTGSTAEEQIEGHVLLASSGYRRLGAQAKLGLKASGFATLHALLVPDPPTPLLLLINADVGTVDLLQFS